VALMKLRASLLTCWQVIVFGSDGHLWWLRMGHARSKQRSRLPAFTVCLVALAAVAPKAHAQTTDAESWQFAVTAYGYLPAISGTAYFPVASIGTSFTLNQSDLIDHLKMTFMGAFDAHRGRWGVFTDVLYLDIGRRNTNIHDFTIGGMGIPANTTSDVSIDMKSWIVNTVGEYRVLSEGDNVLDVVAGARYLSVKERLEWNFTGSIGTLPEAARSGNVEISDSIVDAIVGMKGQVQGDGGWRMPYYIDVGTGGASFTWQGVIGLAYRFHWGEVGLHYRYIEFRIDSNTLKDLTIAGPLLSATFRW
jgi:hypothetical protein